MRLTGKVRVDRSTKRLLERLRAGEIAVIAHRDIDEVAARGLIAARPAVIINADQSISGRYMCRGAQLLYQAGIYILDMVGRKVLDELNDGDYVTIKGCQLYKGDELIAQGCPLTESVIEKALARAEKNLTRELDRFIENTLAYAKKEKNLVLGRHHVKGLKCRIRGRHCLVVVRGHHYLEDLRAIRAYIYEQRPVLIGVDGGADALLGLGFRPDIIVGDMDSVSDAALKCGAELVVHAYPDGRAPGMQRVRQLGLAAHVYAVPGTSEDAALLLADEHGASLIVAVGAHSSMVEFLEKGRPGMASTFLVRLRTGSKLVDAKGVSLLYNPAAPLRYGVLLLIAASLPMWVLFSQSPALVSIARLLLLQLRLVLTGLG